MLVGRDTEPAYHQVAKMRLLARYASKHSGAWVIPFDADELWFAADGTLRTTLTRTKVEVAVALMHNAYPTADPLTWRVETTPHTLPKVAYRPHPLALPHMGNHGVSRAGSSINSLRVLHIPWRSRSQIRQKIFQGAAAFAKTEAPAQHGWHWRENAHRGEASLDQAWQGILDGRHEAALGSSPSGPFRMSDPRDWTTWPSVVGHP